MAPRWTESKKLALVAVQQRRIHEKVEVLAAVLLKREALEALLQPELPYPTLFFCVPRSVLLQESVTSGLTAEDFEQ